MKLRRLGVHQFRGIKSLDWFPQGDFICLVGPGDAGKSTILDAVELVFSPKWNPTFDDSDFYNGDTTEPIRIEATIGELPRALMSDAHFGLRLRGLSNSTIHDEPQDGDEHVITIRLSVRSSLEPTWEVVTNRHPDGASLQVRDRERLGVVRLGGFVERQLSWSKGSTLSRLTGDLDEHAEMLASASRKARESLDESRLPKLAAAATETEHLASAFGVCPKVGYGPALDAGLTTIGAGGIALHDGGVPLRRAGLGTRRLVALAIQRQLAQDGGIVLVDEVEQGLEPYRIRRTLRELLDPSVPKDELCGDRPAKAKPRSSLVLMTSHSPVVLGELDVDHLAIVRSNSGAVQVLQSRSGDVRRQLRTNPEAFLSRKVIVCEGRTELGLLRGLDEAWTKSERPFAAYGVALADGGGCSKIGDAALLFQRLRYRTAILADSDCPLSVTPHTLANEGVEVVLWSGAVSTEERIFLDLPRDGVIEALRLALDECGEDLVRTQIATALRASPNDLPREPVDLLDVCNEDEMRAMLGKVSKSKGAAWYKRVDLGARLGQIVANHLNAIEASDLAKKVGVLRRWVQDVE